MNGSSPWLLEDDGADDDLMFEFEQELAEHLSLNEQAGGATFASLDASADCPHNHGRAGLGGGADASSSYSLLFRARPQNPVAAILRGASDFEEEGEEEEEKEEERGRETRLAFHPSSPPPATARRLEDDGDLMPVFDFNGRCKRKFQDDSVTGVPHVRPRAKRAKSFCSVSSLAQDLAAHHDSMAASRAAMGPSTGFVPIPSTAMQTTIDGSVRNRVTAVTAASTAVTMPRSKSISISDANRENLRPSSFPTLSTTSQTLSRGTRARVNRLSGSCLSSSPGGGGGGGVRMHMGSDPSGTASSWNTTTSLEYFCRRSLDISSPLRLRFRDLMVSSVGRASGINST